MQIIWKCLISASRTKNNLTTNNTPQQLLGVIFGFHYKCTFKFFICSSWDDTIPEPIRSFALREMISFLFFQCFEMKTVFPARLFVTFFCKITVRDRTERELYIVFQGKWKFMSATMAP